MNNMLEAALRYAALKWFIFPIHSIRFDGKCGCGNEKCLSPGKHPRIKWKEGATCDVETVRAWWSKWPRAGIGCATGPSGLLVADADAAQGVWALREVVGEQLPPTARARTSRGVHVFFKGKGGTRSDPDRKLDTRGAGGYVVLAPSPHVSGHVYRWDVPPKAGIAEAPEALVARSLEKKKRDSLPSVAGIAPAAAMVPQHVSATVPSDDFTTRLGGALVDWHEVDQALRTIPPDCKMDEWIRVGMALHTADPAGGLARWDCWSSAGGEKYHGIEETSYKWGTFKQVPDGVGLGTLFAIAKEHGYLPARQAGARRNNREEVMPVDPSKVQANETRPPLSNGAGAVHFPSDFNDEKESAQKPSEEMNGHVVSVLPAEFAQTSSTNPLIQLNEKYAVIGNVGGKCLVLEWQDSQVDDSVKVPSFQSFKSFSERYANQYVKVTKTKRLKSGDEDYEDDAQLGATWLKWSQRRTYEGLELAPNQPKVLPNGNYNLWQGWGVMPTSGSWTRMRDHIGEIMAQGRSDHADYILRWGAWAVQNPGLLAEAALITRGDQGAGKGVFGRALRRIFGSHGLQVFHYKHLVGNFNEHMRSCLFLFADEAHWAGDRQGAATLKGLITEPTRMLEGKGVNAVMWPNRVKLFMAANADWVVPAAHDERRYAVFDVSEKHKQSETYFRPLYAELASGGLAAMLFDLLNMDIGDWTPRRIPQTKALQHQKDLTMEPLMKWWHGMLAGDGEVRFSVEQESAWSGKQLNDALEDEIPKNTFSSKDLAEFLRVMGATSRHTKSGSKWKFPKLSDARAIFEKKFGAHEWRVPADQWALDEEKGK